MKVIDNNTYRLGKDIYGKTHTTKELHDILLKIVLEIDRVCRKNDVPYALGFGSALGIQNYEGFIPWDDDMDIVVDYFDVPRLVEAFKKDLGEDFSFDCYEDNPRYNVLIPTFKVRYKHSFLKERTGITLPNRCHNGDGVFIDMVAFMGVPQDSKEHIKLIKYSKRRMVPYVILDAFLRIHPYKMKKKLKEFERNVAEKYKDSPVVSQTVIIPFQNWESIVDKLSFPRDVIYPFREYDFEGHKLYSFNNVEEFCRLRYSEKSLAKYVDGKWVDNFPMEKRNPSKHYKNYNLSSSDRKRKK